METPHPDDELQRERHEDEPPEDHTTTSADLFTRWRTGALLFFTVGCLFLYEIWIVVLWGPESPLGAWGLALAPLLGVLGPVALVLRRARLPVRQQLWLYRLSARQLFGVLLASLGCIPVCYAAGALNASWWPPNPDYFELFQRLAPTGPGSFLGGFLAVVVFVPLGEEILFRYLVLGMLARHVPALAAVIATGVLFAAAHGAPFVLLPVGLLGVVVGLLTVWSRTLTAAWIGHAIFNVFGYLELSVTGDAATGVVEQIVLKPPVMVAGTLMLVGGLAMLRRDALEHAPRDAAQQASAGGAPSDDRDDPGTHDTDDVS